MTEIGRRKDVVVRGECSVWGSLRSDENGEIRVIEGLGSDENGDEKLG